LISFLSGPQLRPSAHLLPLARATTHAAGDTINVNTGESLHKSLKGWGKLGKGVNITVHIARRLNTRIAATAMMDGVEWEARCYNKRRHRWETEKVRASPHCRELMRTLLDSSQAPRKHGVGRARRTVDWIMTVNTKGAKIAGLPDEEEGWIDSIARASQGFNLRDLNKKWYGCGRLTQEDLCGRPRCMRCWKSRNKGFTETEVRCSNNWTGAPPRASGGGGTLRGCPVQLATPNNRQWMVASQPGGTDVELYSDRAALEAQKPGSTGSCTLGKVAFFLEHMGNPPQGEGTVGEIFRWVGVAEYFSASSGGGGNKDAATGHPVLRLGESLSFFPVEAIRRVVHIHHACGQDGRCKAVSDGNKAPVWRHDVRPGDGFLCNEHFHSVL